MGYGTQAAVKSVDMYCYKPLSPVLQLIVLSGVRPFNYLSGCK